MITKIRGKLLSITDEEATLDIPPFEYAVLIPDFTRRRIQLSIGEEVVLHTIHYLEGNPAQGSRLMPRLVGFVSEIEREFFELFCSVDGVGVRKALRAMVRPVPDVALAIEQEDAKTLSTLPGIGAATADRVIAKLKRKMPKFALLVATDMGDDGVKRDVIEETYQILLTLGHSDAEARRLLEEPLSSKKKFKDVESLLTAVYENTQK
ncbi:MAG TPA: helix-hairpin-helix domain-containing protein [Pirellulaceae bacterium]|nr:helix-hairpin-helix domain-containing protein [Pirellulaceae bacterium]HMO92570.1 helix-hairpin-helix domain-containing protein [Pirellulaceae bacterium]HMP70632.1 helix-hairpin-helix domain-containing protein [Pirellulaceae bacterium]